MTNLAAAIATGLTAIFLAGLTISAVTGMLGAEKIQAPFVWTVLVTNFATSLVAWLTAQASQAQPDTAERRGIATAVFINAAGAIIVLVTNAMESHELHKPANDNGLALVLTAWFDKPTGWMPWYQAILIGLSVLAGALVVYGTTILDDRRTDHTDRGSKPVGWLGLSTISLILTMLTVGIGVSWGPAPGDTRAAMTAASWVARAVVVLSVLGGALLYGWAAAWAVKWFVSTAVRGIFDVFHFVARSPMVRRASVEVVIGLVVGAIACAVLAGVAFLIQKLVELIAPNDAIVRLIPDAASNLFARSWIELPQIGMALAAVLVGVVVVGVSGAFWVRIRKAAVTALAALSNVVKAAANAVRRWWANRKAANPPQRRNLRPLINWTLATVLWPVQAGLFAGAWLLSFRNRRAVELFAACCIVMLPMSVSYEPPVPVGPPPRPPLPPPPPPPPPLESIVIMPVALCEPRLGSVEWSIGSVDRFELPLTACKLPASIRDEYGSLIVVGAASNGRNQDFEEGLALRRGKELAIWASAQVSADMRVYVLNLGMARNADAFRRGRYLWGASGGGRSAAGMLQSVTQRGAPFSNGDVAGALRERTELTNIARSFTRCDLHILDTSTPSKDGPQLVPIAETVCPSR